MLTRKQKPNKVKMFSIAENKQKQTQIDRTNLAPKALARTDEDKVDEEKNRNNDFETMNGRRELRALSWAKAKFDSSVPFRPCGSSISRQSFQSAPSRSNAKEGLWKSFSSVTDVDKIKSSFSLASHALKKVLGHFAYKENSNPPTMKEKMKWLINDMDQFKELKIEMKRRNLVTNFAIRENLEDIVDSRVKFLMMKEIQSKAPA